MAETAGPPVSLSEQNKGVREYSGSLGKLPIGLSFCLSLHREERNKMDMCPLEFNLGTHESWCPVLD